MLKNLFFTMAAVCCMMTGQAQTMFLYDLEVSNGTYTPLTGATEVPIDDMGENGEMFAKTVIDGSGTNNYYGPITAQGFPIGFDFDYNGRTMNQFLIGTDGYIMLGKDEVTSSITSSPFFIFSNDEDTNLFGMVFIEKYYATESTSISYKLEGEAPNRVLVIQYKDIELRGRWDDTKVAARGQIQYRLYESTNNISFTLSGFKPMEGSEDYINFYSAKMGLLGDKGDRIMLSDFVTGAPTTDEYLISYSTQSYPADGVTYTFIHPEPCVTPAEQPTNLQLRATNNSVYGTFEKSAYADTYLTLITKDSELTELPADKVSYAKGGQLGNAIIADLSQNPTIQSGPMLEAGTAYNVFVFACNTKCEGGPLYNTENPLVGQISTVGMPPTNFGVVDADSSQIVVGADVQENYQLVIAYTGERAVEEGMFEDELLSYGVFGELEGVVKAGDAISGGGEVLYVGPATEAAKVEGLEANKLYFFRAWTTDGKGNYSDYEDLGVYTAADVDWTANFSENVSTQVTPVGWKCEGDWRISRNTLNLGVYVPDAENGTEQWIESPDIYLGKNANRLLLDASMSGLSGKAEFKVQVTTDGMTYKDLAAYNSENEMELNDGKLKRYKFYDYAGEKVRFRIWLKAYGRTEVAINSMVVEAVPDCDYPVDLKVESVVGSTAKVAWTPQGEEDHWQVSWKKSDSEEWCEPVISDKPEYEITDLDAVTNYDVRVRAYCSIESQSKWSDSITLLSGPVVPFVYDFSLFEYDVDGWTSAYGELGDPTELSFGSAWSFGYKTGYIFSEYSAGNGWLITPTFTLGADPKNEYKVTFEFINEGEGYGGISTDAVLKMVVSADGENFYTKDVVFSMDQKDFPAVDVPTEYTVNISGYTGDVKIGFYAVSTDGPAPGMVISKFGVENKGTVGIGGVNAGENADGKTVVAVYDAQGRMVSKPVKGLNIIKYSDGTVKKVIEK